MAVSLNCRVLFVGVLAMSESPTVPLGVYIGAPDVLATLE